jgi:hypothetical protein
LLAILAFDAKPHLNWANGGKLHKVDLKAFRGLGPYETGVSWKSLISFLLLAS